MQTKYGDLSDQQIKDAFHSLHSNVFWLMLYKDPNTQNDYLHVDSEKSLANLIIRLYGLNSLLLEPVEMVHLLSTLEAARLELVSEKYTWKQYRKLLLDAHAAIDKLARM